MQDLEKRNRASSNCQTGSPFEIVKQIVKQIQLRIKYHTILKLCILIHLGVLVLRHSTVWKLSTLIINRTSLIPLLWSLNCPWIHWTYDIKQDKSTSQPVNLPGARHLIKHLKLQGWPSGCPKQEEFPARHEPVQSHLPNGLGPRQICQLCKETELALARGKQNLRPTYPKCKLAFYFFQSSDTAHLLSLQAQSNHSK